MKKGKYEKVGRKAFKENKLFYCSSKEMAILSLKVLDFMSKSSENLSVKDQEVGDFIGMDNIVEVTAVVLSAYGYSLPKADEEDDPNRESGQQSS